MHKNVPVSFFYVSIGSIEIIYWRSINDSSNDGEKLKSKEVKFLFFLIDNISRSKRSIFLITFLYDYRPRFCIYPRSCFKFREIYQVETRGLSFIIPIDFYSPETTAFLGKYFKILWKFQRRKFHKFHKASDRGEFVASYYLTQNSKVIFDNISFASVFVATSWKIARESLVTHDVQFDEFTCFPTGITVIRIYYP